MEITLLEISHFTADNEKGYSHLKFITRKTTGLFNKSSFTHTSLCHKHL